jgi:hypothetical protein
MSVFLFIHIPLLVLASRGSTSLNLCRNSLDLAWLWRKEL